MKKTVRRLSAALLALILAVTLLTPALAAGETIDTVSVVLTEDLIPRDGMAIPHDAYPDRSAGVTLAEGQKGYEIMEAKWVSNGSSAGTKDKAEGVFTEGNTYWLYVSLDTEGDASFAEAMTSVLLNGDAVTGKISDGRTNRVSFFQPFTIGEPKSWTVTFDGGGHGTPERTEITVQGGYSITADDISCTGDTEEDLFTGWYMDSECTEPYYGGPIYGDMTLYAGWAVPEGSASLPAITGIVLEEDQLTWDPVPGAECYMLSFYYPASATESIGGRRVNGCSVDLYEQLAFLGAMAKMAGDSIPFGTYGVSITAIDETAFDPMLGTGMLSEETPAGEYLYQDPETILNPDQDPDEEPVNPFEDVTADDYYYDAVLWAVCREPVITNGIDETHFGPEAICTRAQVVTFLWRAAGEPEPAADAAPFTDVDSDAYYCDAVLWAVEEGITNGTSETTFGPDQSCTRAQVVTFLWRAEGTPLPISTSHSFTDMDDTAYYCDAVLWAVEEGVTNGTSETTFGPDQSCTRAQIVTFLYRDMGT